MERMSREDVEGPAELVQGEETEEVGRIMYYIICTKAQHCSKESSLMSSPVNFACRLI